MKKFSISLLLFAAVMTAHSQSSSEDPFTGMKTTKSSKFTLHQGVIEGAKVHLANNEGMIVLALQLYTGNIFSHSQEDEIMIKLDNNEVLTLKAFSEGVARASSHNWYDTFLFHVEHQDLVKLQNHNITHYRIQADDRTFTNEVKKKTVKKFSKAAKQIQL